MLTEFDLFSDLHIEGADPINDFLEELGTATPWEVAHTLFRLLHTEELIPVPGHGKVTRVGTWMDFNTANTRKFMGLKRIIETIYEG